MLPIVNDVNRSHTFPGTSYICCIFLRTKHELMLLLLWIYVQDLSFLLLEQSINSFLLMLWTVFLQIYKCSCKEKDIRNAFTCCYINSYFSTIKVCALLLHKDIHNSYPLLAEKMNTFLIWSFCPHKPSYDLQMKY